MPGQPKPAKAKAPSGPAAKTYAVGTHVQVAGVEGKHVVVSGGNTPAVAPVNDRGSRSGQQIHPPWEALSPHPEGEKAAFAAKAKGLEADTQKAIAKGVKRDAGARSPGATSTSTPKDTGPVPDPNAPVTASGKTSQKRLLAYIKQLSSTPSTADRYSEVRDGKRVYDESRRQLHEQILSKLLDDIPAQPQGTQRVVFTGGGYASGKGGVLKRLSAEGSMPNDALVIDPDRIKAELPEFAANLGTSPDANLQVYEEAWDISQELQRRAVAKNTNVVVDGISNTSREDMLGRVKYFTDAGYQEPRVVYVSIPTDEAVKRAMNRALNAESEADRRYIPESVMRAVHRDVSATVPGVVDGAGDLGLRVEVWNNNMGKAADGSFNPPKRVFSADPGQDPQVEDQALWDEFLAKAHEDISGVETSSELAGKGKVRKAIARLKEDLPDDEIASVLLQLADGPALEEADATADAPTSEEIAELKSRHAKADGVSLKKDAKGYFVHTHRARSKSYPTVRAIPKSVVDFVESTG